MDNTLIIFTSDNGAIFHKEYVEQGQDSNLGLLGQKTDVWEGGMRVPFIVRWPGHIPAGSTVEPLIALMDISKNRLVGRRHHTAGRGLTRCVESARPDYWKIH